VLLIPANKNQFNDTSKNYIKYLEFAYMNVPVIAPNILPYSDLIKTNENGFLCDDKETYAFQLETMLSEPVKFESSLGLAYATATEYNIADKANIEKLIRIYFPDYGK
jgi:glycosyltransferase involved in cell wall biosynthesis